MALKGYFGPRSERRPEPAPAPPPQPTQTELRERRRGQLQHTYSGSWSLTAELHDICTPLAARVAAEPRPAVYLPDIDRVDDAAHGVLCEVSALLAQADAARRTRHLGDDRGRAIRLLVDLAAKPSAPEVTADAVVTGAWATALVELARRYSDDLAGLLSRAYRPAMTPVGGMRSASERLEVVLRELDRSALELSRRLDAAEYRRDERARQPAPSPVDPKAKAAAELQKLGIEV
jgi:hypothetical protein